MAPDEQPDKKDEPRLSDEEQKIFYEELLKIERDEAKPDEPPKDSE